VVAGLLGWGLAGVGSGLNVIIDPEPRSVVLWPVLGRRGYIAYSSLTMCVGYGRLLSIKCFPNGGIGDDFLQPIQFDFSNHGRWHFEPGADHDGI